MSWRRSQVLKRVSHEVSFDEHRTLAPTTPAPHAPREPPSSTATEGYSPFLSAAGNISLNFASSAAQGLSPYDYWGAGAALPAAPFVGAGGGGGGQAFGNEVAFYDTLASEDWTGFNGSDGSGDASGLLGQMAATW